MDQTGDQETSLVDGSASVGRLIKDITGDFTTLIQKEIELAKLEIGEILKEKLRGAALGAMGVALAAIVMPLLLLTIIEVLAIWLPRWAATAIVTGVVVALAVIAFLLAKRALAGKFVPEQTIHSIKEDVAWAKQLKKQ